MPVISIKKEPAAEQFFDTLTTDGMVELFYSLTGRAAVKLSDLMQHHFKEEEDFVLPPLGLLPLLADVYQDKEKRLYK